MAFIDNERFVLTNGNLNHVKIYAFLNRNKYDFYIKIPYRFHFKKDGLKKRKSNFKKIKKILLYKFKKSYSNGGEVLKNVWLNGNDTVYFYEDEGFMGLRFENTMNVFLICLKKDEHK